MLRLEGQQPHRENIRKYQAESLGRFHGNTLLTELMPIPKPKISRWDYDELLPQFFSRRDYYQQIKPQRIIYLRELIAKHRPKVIIGYGKGFWSDYKQLFPQLNFEQNGNFEIAFDGKMAVILTDHFTARSMNGKFDDIVKIVERYNLLNE